MIVVAEVVLHKEYIENLPERMASGYIFDELQYSKRLSSTAASTIYNDKIVLQRVEEGCFDEGPYMYSYKVQPLDKILLAAA